MPSGSCAWCFRKRVRFLYGSRFASRYVQEIPITGARRVAIAANSFWHITNFRWGLIRRIAAQGYTPVVISPGPLPGEAVPDDDGIEWARVDLSRSGLNPAADLRLAAQFLQLFRRTRPKALLSFTIKPNIYGAIAARIAGVPAIPNITGLGTVFVKGGALMRLVTSMYRFALARCPVVFFQNSDDRDLFVARRLVRADQARLLPGSGVDLARFVSSPLPKGPVTFLLLARLLRDKGIHEYVEAARILRSRGVKARWLLLGPVDPGNPTAISREEVEQWVAEGVIEYLGEAKDVRPSIEAASVIVLPSFYREGTPRSLLEGAAMGRPLITTSIAGCRDVVDHGVNGLICPPRDAAALAEAMATLIAMDDDERASMGQDSRKLAEQRFDEQFVFNAYLDVLRELEI